MEEFIRVFDVANLLPFNQIVQIVDEQNGSTVYEGTAKVLNESVDIQVVKVLPQPIRCIRSKNDTLIIAVR